MCLACFYTLPYVLLSSTIEDRTQGRMKLDLTTVRGSDSPAFPRRCCPGESHVIVCVWGAFMEVGGIALWWVNFPSAWLEEKTLLSKGHCNVVQDSQSHCTSTKGQHQSLQWTGSVGDGKPLPGSTNLPLVSSEERLGKKTTPKGLAFFYPSSPIA